MSEHERRDVKRMSESMSVADLHSLLDDRDHWRTRYEKVHADCQEMIRLHDEVEKERDKLRALLAEACDIAAKKRTWRTQVGPNNWERVDLGPDPDDAIRLSAIRTELRQP